MSKCTTRYLLDIRECQSELDRCYDEISATPGVVKALYVLRRQQHLILDLLAELEGDLYEHTGSPGHTPPSA